MSHLIMSFLIFFGTKVGITITQIDGVLFNSQIQTPFAKTSHNHTNGEISYLHLNKFGVCYKTFSENDFSFLDLE